MSQLAVEVLVPGLQGPRGADGADGAAGEAGEVISDASLLTGELPDNCLSDNVPLLDATANSFTGEIIVDQLSTSGFYSPLVVVDDPAGGTATVNPNTSTSFSISTNQSFTLGNPSVSTKNQWIFVWVKNTHGSNPIEVALGNQWGEFSGQTGFLEAGKVGFLMAYYVFSKWYIVNFNSEG